MRSKPRTAASGTKEERHVPGEVGTWIFILGDMTVFAVLFGVYTTYQAADPDLFRASQEHLNQAFGVINTLLLLTSSLLVVTAVRAVRHGVRRIATPLLGGAMLCGLAFVVNKYLEYSHELGAGLTPAKNDFFMYFYVMTGLHLAHLVTGMLVLALLVRLVRREPLTVTQMGYLEGGACFWHMVDLLWIVLFALLYLMHL